MEEAILFFFINVPEQLGIFLLEVMMEEKRIESDATIKTKKKSMWSRIFKSEKDDINAEAETSRKVKKSRDWTKLIARVGIFGAISAILYIIPVPPFNFPIFPGAFSFLSVHLDEIPAFIAGFSYGPLAGTLVLIIRTLIKLPLSSTGMIGELADVIYSIAFVIPAVLIYRRNKSFKNAIIALVVANFIQILVATAGNYFFVYDLYNGFYGGLPFNKLDFVAVIPPFNLIKNTIVIVITLLIYKSIRRTVEKINL